MDIPDHRQEIRVILHRFAFEPILEQMPRPFVFPVVPVYIRRPDPPEDRPQLHFVFFDQQVDMIRHQAPGDQIESVFLL